MNKIFQLFLLLFPIILFSQKIEVLQPKTNFNHWKIINFKSEKEGYIISSDNKMYKTINGGNTWVLDRATILANNEIDTIINLNTDSYNLRKLRVYSKPNDSTYIGTLKIINPLVIKAKNDGSKWTVINGLTTRSLSSIVTKNNNIIIADSNANLFYSTDNGVSFINDSRNDFNTSIYYWPKLKSINDLVYYNKYDSIYLSSNFGKTWKSYKIEIDYLRQRFNDLILINKELGFIKTKKRVSKILLINNKYYVTPIKSDAFDNVYLKKIIYENGKIILLDYYGSIIFSSDNGNSWKINKISENGKFINAEIVNNEVVIATADGYLYYSTNFKDFNKISMKKGYFARNISIYKNYILADFNEIKKLNKAKIFVYNLETNERKLVDIPSGKFRVGITGMVANYVIGYFGSVLKVNL